MAAKQYTGKKYHQRNSITANNKVTDNGYYDIVKALKHNCK